MKEEESHDNKQKATGEARPGRGDIICPQHQLKIEKLENDEEVEDTATPVAAVVAEWHATVAVAATVGEVASVARMAAPAALHQHTGDPATEGETVIFFDEYQEAQLVDDLSAYLVRFLHKKMVRQTRGEQVSLPLRIRAPVWPSIIAVLHERYAGALHLSSTEAIQQLLGQGMKKMFDRGSYAIITPPLIVRFDLRKQDLVAELNYEVYNEKDVIQFPHRWA